MAIVYPDEPVLFARGKYSTLGAERREQIERAAKLSNTMQQHLLLALHGIQERPMKNKASLTALRACLANFETAFNRVEELLEEMEPLKAEAWDGQDA